MIRELQRRQEMRASAGYSSCCCAGGSVRARKAMRSWAKPACACRWQWRRQTQSSRCPTKRACQRWRAEDRLERPDRLPMQWHLRHCARQTRAHSCKSWRYRYRWAFVRYEHTRDPGGERLRGSPGPDVGKHDIAERDMYSMPCHCVHVYSCVRSTSSRGRPLDRVLRGTRSVAPRVSERE